jgi:hypothetical protein
MWGKHRHNLGRSPSSRIYSHAKWKVQDLRFGGRNLRRGVEVELLNSVRDSLRAPHDVHGQVEFDHSRELLKRYFGDRNAPHVGPMLDMWLYGFEWQEIAEHVGKNTKATTKDYWRWIRRAVRDLNLR